MGKDRGGGRLRLALVEIIDRDTLHTDGTRDSLRVGSPSVCLFGLLFAGLVWFGLVWFGSVRFGSVQFNSIRFDSIALFFPSEMCSALLGASPLLDLARGSIDVGLACRDGRPLGDRR